MSLSDYGKSFIIPGVKTQPGPHVRAGGLVHATVRVDALITIWMCLFPSTAGAMANDAIEAHPGPVTCLRCLAVDGVP